MDFHRSAEELQTSRKRLTQSRMPCGGGPKESVEDGSEEQAERLREQLAGLEEVLSEERILRKGNVSVGEWNSEKRLVEISVAKGTHWNVFGKSIQGGLVVTPEEALYMLDHGMLELFHDDLPCSLQQAFELLLSDNFPLHHYVVYSYLRNLGFIVFQFANERRKECNKEKIAESLDCKDRKMTPVADIEEQVVRSGEVKDEEVESKNGRETMAEVKLEDLKGCESMEFTEVETEDKMKDVGKGKYEEQLPGNLFENKDKANEQSEEQKEEKMEDNPVAHYWTDEECQPLVHPRDATSLENILSKLQVIESQTREEASQLSSPSTSFQITYDIFQPEKKFRKSDPGLPDFSVCVCKFAKPPPSIGEMNFLAMESHPVPLKYAVVNGGDVSFYSILDVQLPTCVER